MKKSRLRSYLLLSLLLHVLLLLYIWHLPPSSQLPLDVPINVQFFDPAFQTPPETPPPPVLQAEKVLPPPPQPREKPPEPPPAPEPPKQTEPPPPPPSREGGVVVDLPKPVKEERPDKARIVSRYSSKAQDVGAGESGATRPSGETPRPLPPELALPERYNKQPATKPQEVPAPPATPPVAQAKPPQRQAPPLPQPPQPPQVDRKPEKAAPKARLPEKPREQASRERPPKERPQPPAPAQSKAPVVAQQEKETGKPKTPAAPPERPKKAPEPTPAPQQMARLEPVEPQKPPAPSAKTAKPEEPAASKDRRFDMTLQQELTMLQRERQNSTSEAPGQQSTKQAALDEQLNQIRQGRLQPSFDAPGTYERGPERPGEGGNAGPGGKFRSIASYGVKHFSYLIGLQRKIELVFSVPPFAPDRGAIGVPIVGFTVRRDGTLAEAVLLRSSGYPTLDRALVEAVRRAAPYHPFPEHLTDPSISIRVYANVS